MTLLHPLHTNIPLPEQMNNPFDYEPHPLCIEAARQLQNSFARMSDEWQAEIAKGKMFGILLVSAPNEALLYPPSSTLYPLPSTTHHPSPTTYFLAAYSGQILNRSDWEGFVPAVYDYLQPGGYFKTHEAEVTDINAAIARLEADGRMEEARKCVEELVVQRRQTVADYQQQMNEAKRRRDERRQQGDILPEENARMVRESQFMKAELRRIKKAVNQKTTLEREYEAWQDDIRQLKQLRKRLSDNLQQWLFAQFRMLNAEGESKNLLEIFADTTAGVPPAGSGECCEPKLLQYAYAHGLRPLQIAMFWWGESPKEEIRHHGHYYPACSGKCKPILKWMLPDSSSDFLPASSAHQPPLKTAPELPILYEDASIVVVNKPAGMLSVPGKTDAPSVYSLLRECCPQAEGPIIVHRLDMATSGLLVAAKTSKAYFGLQQQFTDHTVTKRYVAVLEANGPRPSSHPAPKTDSSLLPKGAISLPLSPDLMDRPRQKVDREHGRPAVTDYQLVSSDRLLLYPHTGRTHQLRVHCAHREGLGRPIKGDNLYGTKADRLYLHAEYLSFVHPQTGERMEFECSAPF